MDANIFENILENVRAALEREDFALAAEIVKAMRPGDRADLFNELDEPQQIRLVSMMEPGDAADLVEDLENSEVAELVDDLPHSVFIPILNEMEPDEAADLLRDVEPGSLENILTGMQDENENLVRGLLNYLDDTAGGLMTTVFLTLRSNMTAEEAIRQIRNWQDQPEDTFNIFITDIHGKLSGSVTSYELIKSMPDTVLQQIMDPDVIHVTADTDQEECARLMSRYDLVSLPVTNQAGVMIGIITFDDIVDVLENEATEDIQKLGGAVPLSDTYLNTRIPDIFKRRIGWLLVLFLTEMLTGSVMRFYQNELQSVVALSFFIPLLIGTGGNSGSQATSTIIRALAVGDVEIKDTIRLLWHEMRTGLLLGLVMAAVGFIRALTWHSPIPLALTVSFSLFAIVLWANIVGAFLPPLAARLKIDPAVISGPVMSTLVDATGLVIYFSVAHLLLNI